MFRSKFGREFERESVGGMNELRVHNVFKGKKLGGGCGWKLLLFILSDSSLAHHQLSDNKTNILHKF